MNSRDILALSERNFEDSVDSIIFSERVYSPLIWSGSDTHVVGLAVYVKKGHPFAHYFLL